MQQFYYRLLTTFILFFSCSAYTYGAEVPGLSLAEHYKPGIDLKQYWVSEKLDGVRAYWDGAVLISRQGNTIHAPVWFINALPLQPLDGELWIGHGQFEKTVSTVRKLQPVDDEWRHIRYMIFDLPASNHRFNQRLLQLQRLIPEHSKVVTPVPQWKILNHSALFELLDLVVQQGGEGLILHRADAPYRSGRNRDLLKVKPYYDAEATVLAYKKGRGKYQGKMGSLLVESTDGKRFYIGSGFSDKQRENPPAIGTVITFRYHGLTRKGIPRHASFIRVRADMGL